MANVQPALEPPLETPWGRLQTVRRIGDGVWVVTTPSHGGIWLDPAAQVDINGRFGLSPWLESLEWWEEDVDYTIAYVMLFHRLDEDERTLPLQILAAGGGRWIAEYIERRRDRATADKFTAALAATIAADQDRGDCDCECEHNCSCYPEGESS